MTSHVDVSVYLGSIYERAKATPHPDGKPGQHPGREGNMPDYKLPQAVLDLLPVGTFLIEAEPGTDGYPRDVSRIVKPNEPLNYSPAFLTMGNRLLYMFWTGGNAIKRLHRMPRPPKETCCRYIIQPGDPGFHLMDAFKVLCDSRRAMSGGPVPTKSTLMLRAVGWRGLT